MTDNKSRAEELILKVSDAIIKESKGVNEPPGAYVERMKAVVEAFRQQAISEERERWSRGIEEAGDLIPSNPCDDQILGEEDGHIHDVDCGKCYACFANQWRSKYIATAIRKGGET